MYEELIQERERALVFKILAKLLTDVPGTSYTVKQAYIEVRRHTGELLYNGGIKHINAYLQRLEEIIKFFQEENLLDRTSEDLITMRVGKREAKRILGESKQE